MFLTISIGALLVFMGAYTWFRGVLELPLGDKRVGKILFWYGIAIAGVGGLLTLILEVLT